MAELAGDAPPGHALPIRRRGVRGGASRLPPVGHGRHGPEGGHRRGPGRHRDLAADHRPPRRRRPACRWRRGAAGLTDQTIVHLVPHTHWDREWYEPFQIFRMRLVELVDQLLERMERDPRLRFTLDGQAATVDDYLEVRPERRTADPAADRRGAPGHRAVADPAGRVPRLGRDHHPEPRIRLGAAEELGRAMPIGYLPDMFGHIAQMPQILQKSRDRAGGRLARRPRGDRPQQVRLVGARRLRGRDRVPGRRLRQRRLPVRRPGSLRLEAGRLPDRQRRRSMASARSSPCTGRTTRSPPPPGRCRRCGQCERQRDRGPARDAGRLSPPGPRSTTGRSRAGPGSCVPARGRTC